VQTAAAFDGGKTLQEYYVFFFFANFDILRHTYDDSLWSWIKFNICDVYDFESVLVFEWLIDVLLIFIFIIA
jgi:hypothetical protein